MTDPIDDELCARLVSGGKDLFEPLCRRRHRRCRDDAAGGEPSASAAPILIMDVMAVADRLIALTRLHGIVADHGDAATATAELTAAISDDDGDTTELRRTLDAESVVIGAWMFAAAGRGGRDADDAFLFVASSGHGSHVAWRPLRSFLAIPLVAAYHREHGEWPDDLGTIGIARSDITFTADADGADVALRPPEGTRRADERRWRWHIPAR